jgi:hypothetical protein
MNRLDFLAAQEDFFLVLARHRELADLQLARPLGTDGTEFAAFIASLNEARVPGGAAGLEPFSD